MVGITGTRMPDVQGVQNKMLPENNIEYKSSAIVHLQRTVFKIIEIWRSITSSIQGLFKEGGDRIKKGGLLTSSDVKENIQRLDVAYLDQQVVTCNQITKDYLEKIDRQGKQVMFLPLKIKGKLRDHIVFFAVNKAKKEIIFYDSKGWSLADYGLEDQYQLIKDKYIEFKFVQNLNKEQFDMFNCGVYVIKRIEALSNTIIKEEEKDIEDKSSFNDILDKNPMTYKDAMKAREELSSAPSSNGEDLLVETEIIVLDEGFADIYSEDEAEILAVEALNPHGGRAVNTAKVEGVGLLGGREVKPAEIFARDPFMNRKISGDL